jgi:hypothetical protein
MANHVARLLAFRPHRKGTKVGTAKILFPSGLVVSEITIHRHGSRIWASPPARPLMLDGDNDVVRDADGKIVWDGLIVSFINHGCRHRWSEQAVDAVRAGRPNLFGNDELELFVPPQEDVA